MEVIMAKNAVKLDNPRFYFNRELSWLEFNERVLEEAQDKENPLFERLKFLAITASNMDEFFMIRVSAIMTLVDANSQVNDASGLSPREQLAMISDRTHRMTYKQYNCLNRSIMPALEKENIFLLEYKMLNQKQKDFVRNYFVHTLYPILTPLAVDQSHPFPLLSNKSLNLIINLDDTSLEMFALIQVPSVVPRLLELPKSDDLKTEFILTEKIINEFKSELFSGHNVRNAYAFRITRNMDLSIDEEESDDLLNEIEQSIKRRKWGEPVRLEIEKSMTGDFRRFLFSALKIEDHEAYEIVGPIDLTIFTGISSSPRLKNHSNLRDLKLLPQPVPAFLDRDIFETIREKDVLIHHPYESFDAVTNYISTAANDKQVLAIKQTLYRVSGNSPVVNALIQAAENGKQVTVLVELKARFDEENNILWAKKLEQSGCHVIYGIVGLKTHCKICLVVRREAEGIVRYVHLGTGNYNDSTAKIYTDLSYFTCKESFGQDISALFNVLTGYSINLTWNKIAVAPVSLRSFFLGHIENEISNAEAGLSARIIAKMNSLVDVQVIQALYRASMAGVKIDLIVRGICCLRAGIPEISENIRVVSIVGRFLEHSRIFYFKNGENPQLLLSSADWMPRNLDRRVEVAFPIEDAELKNCLIGILEVSMSDTEKLREQQTDGTYTRIDRRGKEHVNSQLYFQKQAENNYSKAKAAVSEAMLLQARSHESEG